MSYNVLYLTTNKTYFKFHVTIDYIDLAKLAQLLPLVGAPVGAFANYRLVRQLGRTAMNCYRLRHLAAQDATPATM